MKTMIWKELRENFKWAGLALLVLVAAEFFALSTERSSNANDFMSGVVPLCGSTFLLVTSFGCSVIGAALGAMQILPELRRDQWAALLHRPVSRSVIFFGKIGAGLLLYIFTTALAFLASVIYVATPGEFASPFVPGMVLPGLSDLFLGVVFYFEAILLCLHRGKWFGSRGLIGLAALPVFILHLTVGWPFFLTVLTSFVLLLAAWGTMLGNGGMRGRSWPMRLSLVATVLLGAQMFCFLAIAVLHILPGKQSLVSSFTGEFQITLDGRVFFLTEKNDQSDRVLTDMNGNAITDEKYLGNSAYNQFLPLLPVVWQLGKDNTARSQFSPRAGLRYVEPVDRFGGSREQWFRLVGGNYFIGYDTLSRRCLGIVDRDGFKTKASNPKPFLAPIQSRAFPYYKPFLYWVGPQVYSIDFSERSMKPIFNAQAETIYGIGNIIKSYNSDKPAPIAIALAKELRILDPEGMPIVATPYSHDTTIWGSLGITATPTADRLFLEYRPTRYDSPTPGFLEEIDATGKVLHSYSHVINTFYAPEPSWLDRVSFGTMPLVPVLLAQDYWHLFPSPEVSFTSGNGTSLAYGNGAVDSILTMILIPMILSVLTWSWARRVGFSEQDSRYWAYLALCFGLPGLIAFRFASDWPTRARCPECGAKRAIEKASCPACHTFWPPPCAEGTEILDSTPFVSSAT